MNLNIKKNLLFENSYLSTKLRGGLVGKGFKEGAGSAKTINYT